MPFPRIRIASDADVEKATSPSTLMAVVLNRTKRDGEVYAGTVPGRVKAKRRARGKRARAARKAARR